MVKGLLLLQTKQIPPPPFLGTTNSISFRKGQPLLGFHHTELNKYTKKNDRNAPHAGSWSTVWNVMVWGRAYRSMFYSSNGEGMLICWNWGNMFLAPEKDILLVFSWDAPNFEDVTGFSCFWSRPKCTVPSLFISILSVKSVSPGLEYEWVGTTWNAKKWLKKNGWGFPKG